MRQKKGLEYVPTTGVKADLKRFMNKFLEYNTVRFKEFIDLWRDKNMVYLCAGRVTDREAREFLERVLQIAQEYFLPPYQFQVRVGGLYLLYAIYQIQPISPKVKIRLTSSQWRDSVFFQQQAAQQSHLDVVYVFQRLVQEQAFLFCYTPSEMSIHSATKYTDEMMDDLTDTLTEEKTAVTSLFNYDSLEKLSYLQDQYQQMKIELAGPEATAPDKYLAMVQTELVKDADVLLQSFREKVSSCSRQGQKFEAANRPVETIGSRRQMLRSQAYNQLGTQTKKRQRLVADSAASTSPAKAALPGSREAAPMTNKNVLLAVRKNTNKPGRRSRIIDPAGSMNSDGDSDKYHAPAMNNRSTQNKMRWGETSLGDQRQTPTEEQAAADSSTNLNATKDGSAGLEVSFNSMPVIDTTDVDFDDHYSTMRHFVDVKSSRLEGLAEQNARREQPAQIAQAVRKRPKKCPELTCAKEVHNAEINMQTHSCQENCSQGGGPPVVRNNDLAVGKCKDGALLKQKITVNFENIGKEEEQVLQQNTAETKSTIRNRGMPPRCDLLTKGQEVSLSELIVCSDDEHNVSAKKAKYELMYFPASMTSALHASANSTDSGTLRATLNDADLQTGSLSQLVKNIISKDAWPHVSPASRTITPRAADAQKVNLGRRFQFQSRKETVTKIMVGLEIGTPAVVQYQVVDEAVHVRDKLPPILQSSHKYSDCD
ncbi:hypothetical protein BsWGS_18321 [Bradybaena similaris]